MKKNLGTKITKIRKLKLQKFGNKNIKTRNKSYKNPRPKSYKNLGTKMTKYLGTKFTKTIARQSRNPKSIGVFPERVLQLCRRHRRVSRDKSLCFGTLPRRGSAPGTISIDSIASTAVSIDFTAISIDVAVSHDEEGVVLPRG
jgi:hypothetical protein